MNRLDVPSRGECLHCSSHVTPSFERAYGDEDDRAHRCPNCDTRGRIKRGSAAGLDVETPDPLEHPDRFGTGYDDIDPKVRATIDDNLGGGV